MIDLIVLQNMLQTSVVAVPVIIGLMEVFKMAFTLPTRFVPLASVILGVVAGFIFAGLTVTGGLVGVMIGLSSCGLYDIGKKTVYGA